MSDPQGGIFAKLIVAVVSAATKIKQLFSGKKPQ